MLRLATAVGLENPSVNLEVMSLASHFNSSDCAISFELFPPKTEAGIDTLMKNVERLKEFNPTFFTCTYGAGGSTRGTTLDVVEKVKQITDCQSHRI